MRPQTNVSKEHFNIEQKRLISLIEFAQQTALLKNYPVTETNKHNLFNLFEHELAGLPGIKLNGRNEEDELWLSIARLWESQPPATSQEPLSSWLDVSNKPNREPTLKKAIQMESHLAQSPTTNIPPTPGETLIQLSEFSQREILEAQLQIYIENLWKPWALEENKRRRTMKIYAELFTLKQQLEGSITDTQIELVWGIGQGIWKTSEFNICYPLITQLVNISLNEQNMSIEIRPRQADPRLELDIYVAMNNPGISNLEKFAQDFFEKLPHVFSPFEPPSYEPLLRTAITYLDAKGTYWPTQNKVDERQLPIATEELRITDTWVLFARPQSKNLYIQDLENFKKLFNSSDVSLSPVIKAIVNEPLTKHAQTLLPSFRGICTFGNTENPAYKETEDLYFPMPYNEEQVNILQRLECSEGVVVQGPPGTGKTHTIANIISHYMANGKRVLVTSMKEPALTVLKEKLPKKIQPLAITLLANDRGEMKQFDLAVAKMAQELHAIDRASLAREINEKESYIAQLHAKLFSIDRSIENWAKKNIEPIVLEGQNIYPEAAAQEVCNSSGYYEWLNENLTINKEHTPKFTDADIIRLKEARRAIGTDLDYLTAVLPEIDVLSPSTEILNIHRDLSKFNKLKDKLEEINCPLLTDNSKETFEHVAELLKTLTEWKKIKNQINVSDKQWVILAKEFFNKSDTISIIQIFEKLADEINAVFIERNNFLNKPVYIPKELDITEDIFKAIKNKANNKLAFGIIGIFLKADLNKKINDIRIIANRPKTSEEWKHVYQYLLLQHRLKTLILRWNNFAPEMNLPILSDENTNDSIKLAKENIEFYFLIKKCNELEIQIIDRSHLACPTWEYNQEIINDLELAGKFQSILECHYNYQKLERAWSQKENLHNKLINCSGRIVENIKNLINNIIGNPHITEIQLQNEWSNILEELRRIHSLRNYFADVKEICKKISESGAINWAKKLSIEPLQGTVDKLLPDTWQQAWRLQRLSNYLNSLNQHEEFRELSAKRTEQERKLSNAYQEIVAKRTWLKLADNATPDIKAALQAFRTAVTRIGKGTGKRAIRYRRDARHAATKVNKIISCWIMPHYRVSESLPAEFGCFDLVIIDEASQSDLSALPAILRANKLLIVGDDKQVSPEGIGLEEDKINSLMTRFLSEQVDTYRQEMSPERSIYDLFKVVFADSQIMLREHFRCVSPIIEYSKREFYEHELKPIRLPKISERLDPPLIDIIVEDGYRNNKINLSEVKFIVGEIKKICNNPLMKNCSIGVVSLLGLEQAKKIWEMLEQEIGPDLLSRHKIDCGDARTFQGKEKNIIFLSMVVTKEINKADNRDASKQRFNVAASRARDRMYLVRSIELEDLSPIDKLRRNLINHFSSPFGQVDVNVKNLRELCESNFEREIYDVLIELGYRV